MKKKTVIIILSVVGGLALLAGLGAHFIISLKADREAMRKQIVEVKDVYKVFSGHIDTFNEIRNNLYSSVLDINKTGFSIWTHLSEKTVILFLYSCNKSLST